MTKKQQSVTPEQLTITLRGEEYKAERLNKTNYIALGSLVRDKGKMPDLDAPGAKKAVAESMLEKFADPDYMKKLAYSLLLIFPSLSNNNLVWFNPGGATVPPFGLNLEPEEILEIINAVSNSLVPGIAANTPVSPEVDLEKLAEIEAKAVKERERSQKVAALEAELAKMRE